MQLRGVMLADGTACSAEIEQFFYSLWDSSALSSPRYCCIVDVHSWHRVSEINISHPQIQQVITLALSPKDYKFWTPSSKSVPLLNICQNWSNNNISVLPRNNPCEVNRMGQTVGIYKNVGTGEQDKTHCTVFQLFAPLYSECEYLQPVFWQQKQI